MLKYMYNHTADAECWTNPSDSSDFYYSPADIPKYYERKTDSDGNEYYESKYESDDWS